RTEDRLLPTPSGAGERVRPGSLGAWDGGEEAAI
ncbi:MAG: hypothetical protein QOJ69_416, partial [Actinomycetota bacterium]|nr:hypothetical protein [Actinomycetota bacterium]